MAAPFVCRSGQTCDHEPCTNPRCYMQMCALCLHRAKSAQGAWILDILRRFWHVGLVQSGTVRRAWAAPFVCRSGQKSARAQTVRILDTICRFCTRFAPSLLQTGGTDSQIDVQISSPAPFVCRSEQKVRKRDLHESSIRYADFCTGFAPS